MENFLTACNFYHVVPSNQKSCPELEIVHKKCCWNDYNDKTDSCDVGCPSKLVVGYAEKGLGNFGYCNVGHPLKTTL